VKIKDLEKFNELKEKLKNTKYRIEGNYIYIVIPDVAEITVFMKDPSLANKILAFINFLTVLL